LPLTVTLSEKSGSGFRTLSFGFLKGNNFLLASDSLQAGNPQLVIHGTPYDPLPFSPNRTGMAVSFRILLMAL